MNFMRFSLMDQKRLKIHLPQHKIPVVSKHFEERPLIGLKFKKKQTKLNQKKTSNTPKL